MNQAIYCLVVIDKVRKATQYQYSATIACFAVEIFRGMQVGFKLQEFHYRFYLQCTLATTFITLSSFAAKMNLIFIS